MKKFLSQILGLVLCISLVGCGFDEDDLVGSWQDMSTSAGAVIDSKSDLIIEKSAAGLTYSDGNFIGKAALIENILYLTSTEGVNDRYQAILDKAKEMGEVNVGEYVILQENFLVNKDEFFNTELEGEFKPGSKTDCKIRIDYSKADFGTDYQSVAYKDGFIELSSDGTCEFEGELENTFYGSTSSTVNFYEGTYEVYGNVIVMSFRDIEKTYNTYYTHNTYECAFYFDGYNLYNNVYMKK